MRLITRNVVKQSEPDWFMKPFCTYDYEIHLLQTFFCSVVDVGFVTHGLLDIEFLYIPFGFVLPLA